MWTLDEALEIIRELQPQLREMGYHCLLGGGVLNTGVSDKDLDLFFIPLNQHDSTPFAIVEFLGQQLGSFAVSIRDSPDYQGEAMWHYQEMRKIDYCGKRIDIFVQ